MSDRTNRSVTESSIQPDDEQDLDRVIYSDEEEMFQESFDLSQVTADNVDTILHEQFTRFHPSLPTGILIHNTPIFLGLSRVIKKFGLSQIQFEALFQIIMNKKLAIRRKIILVSLLLPRENVPEECVIRVIASIRNSNVKLTKRLLQWIISIYDMVDSTDGQFKNTYPILFHYLTIDAIRTEICHLLYFMTRKERVTKYRIRKLKEMIDKERDNSALIALLMVYKSYDHSIEVPHNIRLKDTIIFEHPDPECRNNLINIKRLWTNTEDELDLHRPIISFSSSTSNNNKARKRSKKNKTESPLTTRTVDIQYRNLDVQEVLHSAENINQLQFNEQLDTMLGDRMLQHVIVCNPDDSLILRIGYWLDQKLLYLLRWPNPKDPGKNEFKELLKKLIKLTQFTKAQLPIVEDFLREYLKIWNGFEFQDEIFELLPFLKPNSFKNINEDILKPLYRLFHVSDVNWKTRLVLCYTEWLKNWVLLDWNQHKALKDTEQEVDQVTWLFKGLSFDTDYFVSMQDFILHVDRLCVIGLAEEQDHSLFQHASISFFELVSSISLQHDIPKIVTPAAPFIYRNFFSTSAMAVDRICRVIYQYKMAFEENERKSDDWISQYSEDYLADFNTYMLNICNSLWKSIGFHEKDKKKQNNQAFSLSTLSIDKLIKTCEERGTDIEKILSLGQSAALAGFSKRFIKTLEEGRFIHDEPMTTEYLNRLQKERVIEMTYQEYRIKYLEYLKEEGLDGIYDLLYSSIKSLINKKERQDMS